MRSLRFPSATGGAKQTIELSFPSLGGLEQYVGPLLARNPPPLRVVGPSSDLSLDPTTYFFFQDNRRAYYVEAQKYYRTGASSPRPCPRTRAPSRTSCSTGSIPSTTRSRACVAPARAGGFDLLYDPELQQAPDAIDPSYPDVFSFANEYQPTWRVTWDLADVTTGLAADINASQTTLTTNAVWVPLPPFSVSVGTEEMNVTAVGGANRTTWTVQRGQNGTAAAAAAAGATVTPLPVSQDRQFLDFSERAVSVYNWELFYHVPKYVARPPQPEPAVRGRADLVPLHLRPDPAGPGPGAAALLDPEAATRPDEHGRSSRNRSRSSCGRQRRRPGRGGPGYGLAERSRSTHSCSPTCGRSPT